MSRNVLFLILTMSVCTAIAQPGQVSLNDSTPPASLPFDQVFSMSYTPAVKKKISSIQLFELDKCGCLKQFKCCSCGLSLLERFCRKCVKADAGGKTQPTTEPVFSISLAPFFQPDSGVVRFRMPALGPNRRFMLVIGAQNKPSGIDEVIGNIHNNKMEDAAQNYGRIVKRTKFNSSSGTPCSTCDIEFEIGTFDDFRLFYADSLKLTVDSLVRADTLLKKAKQVKPPMQPVKETFDIIAVKQLIDFSQECLTCTDTLWQQGWLASNRQELSRALVNIGSLNELDVYSGFADINSFYTTPATTSVKLPDRIANLRKTIELTARLYEFALYYGQKNYATGPQQAHSNFATSLSNALTTLKANYAVLALHQKNITDGEKELSRFSRLRDAKLNRWEGFMQAQDALSSSTFTYNFNTRQGFAIKADFGFLAYGGLPDNGSLRGFAPFLGFHINFRPMNTDIPFRQTACKGLAGHLSFHSGVIVGSFAKSGERDGLVGNHAIFTGLGWAFGHGVRVTSGAVWFRQKHPSPLVNDMATAAVPYVGIALDLRLNDIYKSFTSIFQP